MKEPLFLTLSQVIYTHQDLVEHYGGSHGLQDQGLLESALEMPQAGFGGEFFHKTLFEMAAAYLFHLVKNHPFIDGKAVLSSFVRLVHSPTTEANGLVLLVPTFFLK